MPVATVFENLEVGSSIEEFIEQYDVTREQIPAVLEFAARSLDAPSVPVGAAGRSDARPVDRIAGVEAEAKPGSYAEVEIPFK